MGIRLSPSWRETVSQCRRVIARRLSGVVAISCIRLLRRLLQSLLLLRNDITTQPDGVGGGCQFMQGAQRNPAYSDCPSRNPCHFHLRQRRTNQKRSFNYLIDDVIIYWGIEKEDVFSSFAHEIKRTRPLFDDSLQFTILLKPEPSFPGFPLLLRPFPLRPLPKRAHRADFLL